MLRILVCVLLTASFLSAESFKGPRYIPTGNSVGIVRSYDLNGDGKPDLINHIGFFSILLNDVPGGFTRSQIMGSVNDICGDFAVGDFTNRGKLDIAVTCGANNTGYVYVYPGNGDGTFDSPIVSEYSIGNLSNYYYVFSGINASDLNGDGNLDLVVSGNGTGNLLTLLGNGDGAFTLKSNYSYYIGSLLVSDIDGDGKPDVLLGSKFFRGNGDGTLQSFTTLISPEPTQPMLIDMNGDGVPDLVGMSNSVVSIWKGEGGGVFDMAPRQVGATSPYFAAKYLIADLNRDGLPDIIAIYTGNNDMMGVMLNQGNWQFSSPVYYFGDPLLAGDFNNDGNVDVLGSAEFGLTLFAGDGAGGLQDLDAYPFTKNDITFAVADFNNDGHPDIVRGYSVDPPVLINKGNGTFTKVGGEGESRSSAAVVAGDFDGDGKQDLFGLYSANVRAMYYGLGDGTFNSPVLLSSGITTDYMVDPVEADLNGDGLSDVLLGTAGYYIQTLLGQGLRTPTLAASSNSYPVDLLRSPAFGDVNGDGKLDLVDQTYDAQLGDYYIVFTGNGDGTFNYSNLVFTYNLSGQIRIPPFALVDLDGDGKLDIVTCQTVSYGKGDGTFREATALPSANLSCSAVTAADVDQDGHPDLVISSGNLLHIFHGLGSRTFGSDVTWYVGASPISLVDLNGDGYPDVIATGGKSINVALNDPTGGRLTPVSALTSSNASAQYGDAPPSLTLALSAPSGASYTPTGVVYFTLSMVGGDADMDGGESHLVNGSATYTIPAGMGIATYMVTARYAGDSHYQPISAVVEQDITRKDVVTTTSLTASPSSPVAGQTVTLTATVSAGVTLCSFTNVHFYDNGVYIGAADMDTTGKASLTTAILSAGAHSLTAKFQGSENLRYLWQPSVSATTPLTVNAYASTVSLTASSSSPMIGDSVTLTAKVSSSGGSPVGSVSFYDGSTLLATRALNSSDVATHVAVFSTTGGHSLTAVYMGSAPYASGSSSAVTINVLASSGKSADFLLRAVSDDATLNSSSAASVAIHVIPINGFSDAVTLSCQVSNGYACTLDQTTFRKAGQAAATISAKSSAALHRDGRLSVLLTLFCSGLLLAPLRRRRQAALLLLICALALAGLSGCGSASPATTSNGATVTIRGVAIHNGSTVERTATLTLKAD